MCFTINFNIFIIVIIGCPILNCMIHYNVCNYKGIYCTILCTVETIVGQWKLMWASGSGNPTSPPCELYVSLGQVRPRTFGCIAMGSEVLFILKSRLLVYSTGSRVNRVQVVLPGFSVRWLCFVQTKTSCRYSRARNNRVRIAICESKSACCESN